MDRLSRCIYSSEDDSESDLSECEERCPDSVVDSLLECSLGSKLTPEELIFISSYTYDKEPVKAWRQVTDYIAIKECNDLKWEKISQYLGKFNGFSNSLQLYKSKSTLTNLIERIICVNKCYFFPDKCPLAHGFDFKNLMKKSLHDKYNPTFENIFKEQNSNVELEVEPSGRPKLLKLAEDIGFNTALEYDADGILEANFHVFKEQFWKKERPCYIQEEKKILDVIHALLVASSKMQVDEMEKAKYIYSQNMPGLNDPVLKTMCFGPDIDFESYETKTNCCDITEDEGKVKLTDLNVVHKNCSFLKRDDHWKYFHGKCDIDISECKSDKKLEGPVSQKDSQLIHYPCNLNHCWISCDCKFCRLTSLIKCKNHRDHMRFNIRQCIIQEQAQCQEHWLDHIENFNEDEDIEIDRNFIFHNNEIQRNGRNYSYQSLKYPGLKLACKKCRKSTKEHVHKHLTPHIQCKHCAYEMKTMKDKSFWEKVCNVCGKVFDRKSSRKYHEKRYDLPEQMCEICETKCTSKYNLHRHMREQHNSMQENSPSSDIQSDHSFLCEICNKSFRYVRNLKSHVYSSHEQQETYQCRLCEKIISTRSHLKRHLEEQHNIFDFNTAVHTKEPVEFICQICEKHFKRKTNLERHLTIHSSDGEKYSCNDCGKQFLSKFNLSRHQKIHTGDSDKFECEFCKKVFPFKGNLARHIQGIHK